MKKILFSVLLFLSSYIYGQNSKLQFLKSPINKGDPTIEEAVKWLSKNLNLAHKGGDVLIDNQGGWRETEYPCNDKSGIQTLDLNYNSLRNEISFSVDNMGCYAGAYPKESAVIVIFLDNLSSYFNIVKDNNRVELRSWNFDKKGSNYSDRVLGYIKYDNYDNCSGVSLRSFYTLSFAVNIVDRDKENKLELALQYLQNKTSAQQKICRDFGACLAPNTNILL